MLHQSEAGSSPRLPVVVEHERTITKSNNRKKFHHTTQRRDLLYNLTDYIWQRHHTTFQVSIPHRQVKDLNTSTFQTARHSRRKLQSRCTHDLCRPDVAPLSFIVSENGRLNTTCIQHDSLLRVRNYFFYAVLFFQTEHCE